MGAQDDLAPAARCVWCLLRVASSTSGVVLSFHVVNREGFLASLQLCRCRSLGRGVRGYCAADPNSAVRRATLKARAHHTQAS